MKIESVEIPSKSFTKKGFSCGINELDDYFKLFAFKNHKLGIAKAYVILGDQSLAEPKALGFYTLNMASIESNAAQEIMDKVPRYPIPVALIGRLAVHKNCHGKGIGARLLRDAFVRVLRASNEVGCIGVIVDAKSVQAETFYTKFGFKRLLNTAYPIKMGIHLDTVREACS